MPTKAKIKAHWAERLVEMGKFDSLHEVNEADYCFACGCFTASLTHNTERCHIIPKRYDGPDTPENLHLLCGLCHVQSETIFDDERNPELALANYWIWFKAQNMMTVIANMVKFEEREKGWLEQKKEWAMESARRRREGLLENIKNLKP